MIAATLALLAFLGAAPAPAPEPRVTDSRLTEKTFRDMLGRIARAWNTGDAAAAAACFRDDALYVEPPDRQRYEGRAAIGRFFAASVVPVRADRMTWHRSAFDSRSQVGFGEYTYRGRRDYHGVAVLELEGGRIRTWREYQYEQERKKEK